MNLSSIFVRSQDSRSKVEAQVLVQVWAMVLELAKVKARVREYRKYR